MNPERPKSQNELRADQVMEYLRSGKFKNVPAAIRQVLNNERITHEPDVKRIMSEVGSVLKKRQQYTEEDEMWKDFLETQMLEGAWEAYKTRGGDPDDDDFESHSDDYRIGPRL